MIVNQAIDISMSGKRGSFTVTGARQKHLRLGLYGNRLVSNCGNLCKDCKNCETYYWQTRNENLSWLYTRDTMYYSCVLFFSCGLCPHLTPLKENNMKLSEVATEQLVRIKRNGMVGFKTSWDGRDIFVNICDLEIHDFDGNFDDMEIELIVDGEFYFTVEVSFKRII